MAKETLNQRDAASPRNLKVRAFENVKAITKALTRSLTTTTESPKLDTVHANPTTRLNLDCQAAGESKPKKLFFYGSLMDPDVLHAIARTSTEPELHKATIRGFKMRIWGCYPTLVPGDAADTIHGVYWRAENEGQLALLQHYETNQYRPASCAIHIEKDGNVIKDGLTFVWAGDPESRELEDGQFSLEEYQDYYKPDVFKRTH